MSPELWAIERHYMAFAGFDDLTCSLTGVDQDGQLFLPTAEYISNAFNLLETGLELPRSSLVANQEEFVAALNADADQQAALLQVALDRLVGRLGFTPQAPQVIGTIKLAEPS